MKERIFVIDDGGCVSVMVVIFLGFGRMLLEEKIWLKNDRFGILNLYFGRFSVSLLV